MIYIALTNRLTWGKGPDIPTAKRQARKAAGPGVRNVVTKVFKVDGDDNAYVDGTGDIRLRR